MDEDEREEERASVTGTAEMVRVYGWVWRSLLGPETRTGVKWMLGWIALSNVLGAVIPWLIGGLIDHLGDPHAAGAIVWFTVAAAALIFRDQLVQYQEARRRELILGSSERELDDACNRLFMEKSMGQHLRDHDRLSAANMEKGRARVVDSVHLMAFEGWQTLFMLASSFTCLCFETRLGGLIVGANFVLFAIWSRFLNRRVFEVCIPLDEELRAINRYRSERWERIERVKSFGKEEEEVAFMAQRFHSFLRGDRRFWLWYIGQSTWRNFLGILTLLIVLAFAAWRIRQGVWSKGLLFPLFAWTVGITSNLWRLGHIQQRLSWNMSSIRSMMRALMMPPDVIEKPDARILTGNGADVRVELLGISHGYHDRRHGEIQPILRDVSFTIEPGERVALLGRSGAGKSTIMRLLQRGMDPQRGSIRINGHDLRDLRLKSWLDCVGYIPQQPSVLDGTIRYNLVYGFDDAIRSSVTDEALWQLARDLQIDFGPRLTIGTAVAKKPQFMLIDEATSSLDSTTERAVQDGLRKALEGGTSALIIAHRLSTVRDLCDKFVVLRRLDEVGEGESQVEAVAHSFDELAEISATFRMLARDQHIAVR